VRLGRGSPACSLSFPYGIKMKKKKKRTLKRRILTPMQATVLRNLAIMKTAKMPKDSLKLLEKKGLVEGNAQQGWVLSRGGLEWLATEDCLSNRGRIW
jgi:hypothetical protein